ncbi:hypothetical protein MJO29_002307 [Puccinia striiformis f. sp. tritici]|nr:hypothetical protein MJO29_002307 [Puccinia striiformis f. sp. tritici]
MTSNPPPKFSRVFSYLRPVLISSSVSGVEPTMSRIRLLVPAIGSWFFAASVNLAIAASSSSTSWSISSSSSCSLEEEEDKLKI